MTQPQELPSNAPTAHELPSEGAQTSAQKQYQTAPSQPHHQQYYAPSQSVPQTPGSEYIPTPSQTPGPHGPISEYVPTPSQTPAPAASHGYPPVPPPQPYVTPDQQYPTYNPSSQQQSAYYQQASPTGQTDPEKGAVAVSSYAPPGNGVPAYIPPTAGGATTGAGLTGKKMITLFGKQYTQKAVIIVSVVLALVLIFIIGLGAGLGSQGKGGGSSSGGSGRSGGGNGFDSGSDGSSGCEAITDIDLNHQCWDNTFDMLDNSADYIRKKRGI